MCEPISDKTRKNISNFESQLEHLINMYSMEGLSGTPDFILARYLMSCLTAFNIATNDRDTWHEKRENEE